MPNMKTALFALAFLAQQVISENTCPPCYTHTVTVTDKKCPIADCLPGFHCPDLPIPPTKVPTLTIPGPNPACPTTSTKTALAKCWNHCDCADLVESQGYNLQVTKTTPALTCRSTGPPIITKTLPPIPTTTSCRKYTTTTDGLMCPMIACVRQVKPCDLLPTLPPRPTKVTMTRTRGCTVTHIVGAPCPQCPRCRLEIPAETDYPVPIER